VFHLHTFGYNCAPVVCSPARLRDLPALTFQACGLYECGLLGQST